MGQKVAACQTTLLGEEVVVGPIRLFANERRWVQTQSARTADFAGRGGIPRDHIIIGSILVIVGAFLCAPPIGAICRCFSISNRNNLTGEC